MRRKLLWMICGLAALVPYATAQGDAPVPPGAEKKAPKDEASKKPVELDAKAKELFDAWEKKEYHLGRAGVKSAAFKMKVTNKSPMGEMTSTVHYAATVGKDGVKSTMKWENAMMGQMAEQQGQGRDAYDQWFDPNYARNSLKGCKVTTTETEEGYSLAVAGKNKAGIKELRFNKDGALVKMLTSKNSPMMGETTSTMVPEYKVVDDKYHVVGFTVSFKMAMGEGTAKIAIQTQKKGDFHVPVKQTVTFQFGGMAGGSTMDFTDWKLNEKEADGCGCGSGCGCGCGAK